MCCILCWHLVWLLLLPSQPRLTCGDVGGGVPRCKVPRCEIKVLMQQRHINPCCMVCVSGNRRAAARQGQRSGKHVCAGDAAIQFGGGGSRCHDYQGARSSQLRRASERWAFVVCSLFSNVRSAPPSPGRFDCTAQLLRARGTLKAAAKRGTLTAMGPRPLAVNVSALHQAH
jgi:hypothetical protein